MRALLQRVHQAGVKLPDGEHRTIGKGLLIYLGVGHGDTTDTAKRLADKAARLRIFSNAEGKFDRSALDEKAELLVISQFTLYGNPKGGRRPDFTAAAPPARASELYETFVGLLRAHGLAVKTGVFAAHMLVDSVNDGPVTLWLDTEFF